MATIDSFDLLPTGANHFVVMANGHMLREPVELNDAPSRVRFAQDFARERGWNVRTVPQFGYGRYELVRPVPMPEIISPPPPGQLTVALPGPAAAAVARTLEETGDTPGAMVAKALGLYMMALEAKRRGKVVGAADSADVLETEFTGF